jgi:ribosomal protein S18 acetylase RimI-like enzyme|tara:strand:+ start:5932 stop:6405 length:474 start_codon:yes stop_codon:yes gene_type:complete
MHTRQANIADAAEISAFMQELTALGKRTMPSDEDYVRTHYITHPDNIQCTVAVDEGGSVLGLQILKIASQENVYGVTQGWGIIGTHVAPNAAPRGVGKTLFAATLEAAINTGLQKIDATIGAINIDGLAYYEAIGFQTYNTPNGKVCKCYTLNPNRS